MILAIKERYIRSPGISCLGDFGRRPVGQPIEDETCPGPVPQVRRCMDWQDTGAAKTAARGEQIKDITLLDEARIVNGQVTVKRQQLWLVRHGMLETSERENWCDEQDRNFVRPISHFGVLLLLQLVPAFAFQRPSIV